MALRTPFYDDVLAYTYKPLKKLHLTKDAEPTLLQYRMALKSARRFVIDDDMVRLTATAASTRIDKMELWMILARLPFDTCWFEMDHSVRLTTMGKSTVDTSRQIGWLMQRDKTSPTRWYATEFLNMSKDPALMEATHNLITYVIDPDGDPTRPADSYGKVKPLSVEMGFQKDIPHALIGLKAANGDIVKVDWADFKVGVTLEPLTRHMFALAEHIPDHIRSAVMEQVMESQGIYRYLITMLAAINDVPVLYREVDARPGSNRINLKSFPYLSHTVVSIKAPKTKPVEWLVKKIDGAAGRRKRAHDVRGHWRVVVTRDRVVKGRTWVNAHQRGDASLGFVKHRYVVEAS